MSKYFLHGKFTAQSGYRDELSNILLDASRLVASAKGCNLYIIGIDPKDGNTVFVTEVWDSKEDHDNSLKVEGVGELIKRTMLILDGQPTRGQELEILGGAGI